MHGFRKVIFGGLEKRDFFEMKLFYYFYATNDYLEKYPSGSVHLALFLVPSIPDLKPSVLSE